MGDYRVFSIFSEVAWHRAFASELISANTMPSTLERREPLLISLTSSRTPGKYEHGYATAGPKVGDYSSLSASDRS